MDPDEKKPDAPAEEEFDAEKDIEEANRLGDQLWEILRQGLSETPPKTLH